MKSTKLVNGEVKIIEIEKPKLKGTGAIIKVFGCGLCGSDLVKIRHSTLENEDKIVLGHEVVGQIVEINDLNGSFKVGDIVALGHHYPCFNCNYCKNKSYSMCRGFKKTNIIPAGFSEYIKVDEGHLKYSVFKMNENLDDDEKAFVEPLSCCLRAIRRAGFEYGHNDNSNHNALVIGLGSIGLLMLKGLKVFEVDACGFDTAQNRMEIAKKQGFTYKKQKYDAVFLTAGSTRAIKTALENVIDGGKIIVFSSVEDNFKGFFNNEIYYRELSIIASYSPAPADLKLSAQLLNNGTVKVKGLSTHYKLEELNKAIEESNKVLKAYIEL